MVSVMGKELVPYDPNVTRNYSTPSSSSSAMSCQVIDDSSPPTEEDDSNGNYISDTCSDSKLDDSDSDLSSQDPLTLTKTNPLALLERIPLITDVDPACVKEILADHALYPPIHKDGDREDRPATQETLDYFYKVLSLKSTKYSKLEGCKIPESLRSVPLALSYKSFITFYWPGAVICCKKLFKSPQTYSSHFYKLHKAPSPPLNLACMEPIVEKNAGEEVAKKKSLIPFVTAALDAESDSSSDVMFIHEGATEKKGKTLIPSQQNHLPKRPVGRPSNSNDHSGARKRKSLSPSSRPGPLRHKHAKLNHTISVLVDSSLESGDEKHSNRPKRSIKRRNSQDETERRNEEWTNQLNADQMRYQPQHEPGAPENFLATAPRLKYFSEVLAVKLTKYGHLNSNRPNSPSRHIPLALGLHGFMQYYWPGKIMCCGLIRENLNSLEKHVSRSHRPPKPPPNLELVTPSPPTPPVSDHSEGAAVSHKAKSSKSDSSKYPPGFEDDQDHFPPQHKPGDPEDFLANQDCIDYFVQALSVKWEKYSHLAPLKGEPLSSALSDFVLHYWPGMMSCCDKVYTTCKSFQLHLTTSHLPSKKIPQLVVVDQSAIPQSQVPEPSGSNPDPTRTDSPIPHRSSPRTRRTSRLANDSDQSQSLSILNTPSHLLRVNAVQQEARQLRIQATQVTIVSELLPMLERLFELSSSIITGLRGSMEVEARSHAVECLEYVWNASKMVIMRWVDINGCTTRDPFLTAVQYAYGTLPVFTNLEQNKHLEMIENVIVLSVNAVKNWEPAPCSPEAKKGNRPPLRRRTVKQMRTEAATQEPPVASSSSATHTPKEATSSQNIEQIKEFCRLANISVWQNTKARALTGHKDDQGRYNVMYRYGIAQMLKLYCPSGVTHLKCCGELFDLANLRVHVSKLHEGFHPERTEPSISPA